MKITFYYNFMNHHQLPLSKEIVKIIGSNFKFVATQKIPNERLNMGYEDMNQKYDFIIRAYDNDKVATELAAESDIVIIGSAPDKYAKICLNNGGIVLRYSERVFKNGFSIKTFLSLFFKTTLFERKNTYLLCASAYAAHDYNISGAFINKTFKWGYFPEVKEYEDINTILQRKEKNTILWAGRFIEWKHPETVIEVAKRLKDDNYNFKINMIGNGKLKNKIDELIQKYNLSENVKLLGTMSPENVRKYMENSEIYLFTSDRNEGWGAVLNESMNSACAVVASHEIGSVPFLIKDKENGLIYENKNTDDLYKKVKELLDNKNITIKLGKKAYYTMLDAWNPKIAARRIVELSKCLLNSKNFSIYNEGPCSIAEKIYDNWYRRK